MIFVHIYGTLAHHRRWLLQLRELAPEYIGINIDVQLVRLDRELANLARYIPPPLPEEE